MVCGDRSWERGGEETAVRILSPQPKQRVPPCALDENSPWVSTVTSLDGSGKQVTLKSQSGFVGLICCLRSGQEGGFAFELDCR